MENIYRFKLFTIKNGTKLFIPKTNQYDNNYMFIWKLIIESLILTFINNLGQKVELKNIVITKCI